MFTLLLFGCLGDLSGDLCAVWHVTGGHVLRYVCVCV